MAPQREWFEKDYYSTLGVSKEASEKEVTRAYRTLAKKHHPDANPGSKDAEERFKAVSAAYDVLGDPAKRKEYDEVRRMAVSGRGGGMGGPGTTFTDFGGGFDPGSEGGGLGDVFSTLFGGRGRRGGGGPSRTGAGPRRGGDLEAEVHLSFNDTVQGAVISVELTGAARCSMCAGTGAAPGTTAHQCPVCNGAGNLAVEQGPFSFSQVCNRCAGIGRIIDTPCPRCGGGGAETRTREQKVRIPVGVSDGERVRVKGRGTQGRNGGPPGDLFVTTHVAPHALFERRGPDLRLRVPVTMAEAALGAQVRVPTLTTPVTVRIPPGTAGGKVLRVSGRGMPKPSGPPGDLLVVVEVAVPKDLTDDQRHALEAFAAATTTDPRRHLDV